MYHFRKMSLNVALKHNLISTMEENFGHKKRHSVDDKTIENKESIIYGQWNV